MTGVMSGVMARSRMRWLLVLALAACSACGRSPAPEAQPPASPPAPAAGGLAGLPAADLKSLCPPDGDSYLKARVRGALDLDLEWKAGQINCDGGMRPSGGGLRAALAGPASTAGKPRSLRFIFGINLKDAASGPAVALPTNLTVILEGEGSLFATRGEDRCASEILSRQPLKGGATGMQRLQVRGYCTGPADDTSGKQQLLVSTFEFTTVVRVEVLQSEGT